ncbi:DUF1631 family protein [Dyella sp. SG609]|uniref:DUF1631 family protein n=1 Tax=Dyella sp. SG609 TaxID=2587018 RepID=UPI001446CA5A|nr:DUF1631 family protein [Dyella sp. SG609]NKJ21243.1 hypothetical protein [Dyella sp. SG609]
MDVEQGRRQPLAPGHGAQPDGHGAWSLRARRLIEETHALCDSWLEAPLRACLLDAEHKLFGQAEQARNHLDQQVHMSVRQRLQSHRDMLEQRFFAEVAKRFERIGIQPEETAPLTLSLLDDGEDDERAALEQSGVRSEARHAPALFELSFRFGALASLPPMEGEDLPLGAQALSRCFLEALRDWELPVRHRLLLLDAFDHMVVRHLASLYETVNQHLAGEGILPHLHAYRVARPGDARGLRSPAAAIPGSLPAGIGGPQVELGEHMLDMLRELLSLQRAAAPPPAPMGQALSDEQLQHLLAALQLPLAQAAQQVAAEGQALRLREQLLALLNAGTEHSTPKLSLSPRQDDTVQLVALLFEQMAGGMQRGSHAQRMLGEWEVPLLRMALADRDVFDQREHPARRLLAAMSEAAHDWLDGGDADVDRSLATKLAQLAERAQREPPSAALYASLLTDIEHHLSLLSRKAQATERRQVEAMQGRERLEHARHHAAELMAERFRAAPPRGLVRTLLERAWSDVLALTLLRNGEESDTFAARLRITDQLLGLAPIDDRNSLLDDIQTGLQQIGMQAEEAAQVARRLLGNGDETAADDGLTATGVAMKLKQHQRLGEHQATEAATPPEAAKAAVPLDDEERRMHAHVLTLPFGTWFDFLDDAGQVARTQKLAWYSTVSGRCLFVTRRGSRGDELALEQLARQLVQGHIREAVAPRENLFDRALRALMENLRPGAAHAGGRQ